MSDLELEITAAAAKAKKAKAAPQYAPNGVPMNDAAKAEIIANAKSGNLSATQSPASAEMDAAAFEQMQPQPGIGASIMGAAGDNVRNLGGIAAGLGRGVLKVAGLPGTVGDGMDWLAKKAGILREDALGSVLSGDALVKSASAATGGAIDYQGVGTPGRYLSAAAEAVPQAFALGGGAPAVVPYGVVPALASEAAGDATRGKSIPESIPLVGGMNAEPLARIAAVLASPMAYRGVQKLITPNPADPRYLDAAAKLKAEGVDLTAGQKVGSPNIRYIEDTQKRTQDIVSGQADQFTSAALKRIGVAGNAATPDVMKTAGDDLGRVFDDLAARNTIVPDPQMAADAQTALTAYSRNTSRMNVIPAVKDVVTKIDDAVTAGTPITGAQYQTWRSELGRLSVKGDNNSAKEAARQLIGVLDDAMERTLKASGNTADLAAYSKVRGQWRDYLAIADAVDGAGANAAMGVVTPQNLGGAVRAQDDMAYVTGQRDLGELSRSGVVGMAPLPNSGTQPRIAANTLPGASAGLAGGMATMGLTQNPTIAVIAGLLSTLAPAARNAFVASKPGQAWIANQLITNRTPAASPAMIPEIVRALQAN